MEAGRPFQGWLGSAVGEWTMCSPRRSAPALMAWLAQLYGKGGSGKGRLRGASNGLASAPVGPEMPISYSTRS